MFLRAFARSPCNPSYGRGRLRRMEDSERLVRTTVLVPEHVLQALKDLAQAAERPLSWEIRRALEDYVTARAT